jgi:hypothetical protein
MIGNDAESLLRCYIREKHQETGNPPHILYFLYFKLCKSYRNDLLKTLLLEIECSKTYCPGQYYQYNSKQRKMIIK